MYAVIKTNGFQYTVEKGQKIVIPALLGKIGDSITFDEVLLLNRDKDVEIGRPTLTDVKVEARIVKVGRLDKILIYKFIRREKYRRKQGHRQDFCEVEVTDIKIGK